MYLILCTLKRYSITQPDRTLFFLIFSYFIEVLEIMAQMRQYMSLLSLKSIKVSSDFILNYLKKVVGGATAQKYQKQMLKP